MLRVSKVYDNYCRSRGIVVAQGAEAGRHCSTFQIDPNSELQLM
jgi:hypothetical protein